MQDVEVRGSAIEGLDVFALRFIAPGQRIWQVNIVREVTPDAPYGRIRASASSTVATPTGRSYSGTSRTAT